MPGSRVPWGTVSRERVIQVATKRVRAGRYEELTIRGLASELGVSPMSLYRHVRSKDDLIDEVVDRLLARCWRPRTVSDDWLAWVAEAADRLRRFLVSQPAALHVYLRHPVVSPAAIARMDAIMEVLRRALPDEDSARRAYGAIHSYTVGFGVLQASRAGWAPPETDPDGLAQQLAAYTTPRQFGEGLRYLLDGLCAQALFKAAEARVP